MLERLFVYGTLAPGKPNAHMLGAVAGHWQEAWINGHLLKKGWGSMILKVPSTDQSLLRFAS